MVEEYLELAAVTALAVVAATTFAYTTTPAVCQAVRPVAENPGNELVVYGGLKVNATRVSLCCLVIERHKIIIEKTEEVLKIGGADGVVYIR